MRKVVPLAIDATFLAQLIERLRQGAGEARGTVATETIGAVRRSLIPLSERWGLPDSRALAAAAEIVSDYIDTLWAIRGRKASAWAIDATHHIASHYSATKAQVERLALKRMGYQLATHQQQGAPIA